MKKQSKDQGDSSSDWDSLPETGIKSSSVENTVSTSKPNSNSKSVENPPPYNFRSEAGGTEIAVPVNHPPGKAKKGHVYSPNHTDYQVDHITPITIPSQKGRVSFSDQSDDDDPLYSTVMKKLPPLNHNNHKNKKTSNSRDRGKTSTKRVSRNQESEYTRSNEMIGVQNEGFVDDDVTTIDERNGKSFRSPVSFPKPNERDLPANQKNINSNVYNDNNLIIFNNNDNLSHDSQHKLLQTINKLLSNGFAFITFPIACFALFMHHLFRFVMLGLIKPVLIDTATVIIVFLFQPCINGFILPLCKVIHPISVSITDIILVCIKPLTSLFQSVRLIQINQYSQARLENV